MSIDEVYQRMNHILESRFSVSNKKFLVNSSSICSAKYKAIIKLVKEVDSVTAYYKIYNIGFIHENFHCFNKLEQMSIFEFSIKQMEDMLEAMKDIGRRVETDIVFNHIGIPYNGQVFISFSEKEGDKRCSLEIELESKNIKLVLKSYLSKSGKRLEEKCKGEDINIWSVLNEDAHEIYRKPTRTNHDK